MSSEAFDTLSPAQQLVVIKILESHLNLTREQVTLTKYLSFGNIVLKVLSNLDERKLIIRLFRYGSEEREIEFKVFSYLSEQGWIPIKLLETQESYRVETFLEGAHLTYEDAIQRDIQLQLMQKLAALNYNKDLLKLGEQLNSYSDIRDVMFGERENLVPRYNKIKGHLWEKYQGNEKRLEILKYYNSLSEDMSGLQALYEELTFKDPRPGIDLVFCHNDLHFENMLLSEEGEGKKAITILDYEDCAIGPRGFDVASFITFTILEEESSDEEDEEEEEEEKEESKEPPKINEYFIEDLQGDSSKSDILFKEYLTHSFKLNPSWDISLEAFLEKEVPILRTQVMRLILDYLVRWAFWALVAHHKRNYAHEKYFFDIAEEQRDRFLEIKDSFLESIRQWDKERTGLSGLVMAGKEKEEKKKQPAAGLQ